MKGRVVEKSANEMAEKVIELITSYGLDVVGALAILIAGWIAARWVERMVRRALSKTGRIDATLHPFFGDLARWSVLIFTGFAVLSQFGIQTANVLTVFGAGALAIGMALQGTLSNVAAGVMLLIVRPFKIDDYVEARTSRTTMTPSAMRNFFIGGLLSCGDHMLAQKMPR